MRHPIHSMTAVIDLALSSSGVTLKKIVSLATAIAMTSIALLLCGCANTYSVNTEGTSGIYPIGEPIPNDDNSSVVNVVRTGYGVEVNVWVSSGTPVGLPLDENSSTGPISDWDGMSLTISADENDNTVYGGPIGPLSSDQLTSLKCVLKAKQPFSIHFEHVSSSDRYVVQDKQGHYRPSRDENNHGKVINTDCSVSELDKASVSAVYLIEVNTAG